MRIRATRPSIGKSFDHYTIVDHPGGSTPLRVPLFDQGVVRAEPQLFTASVGFAYANGGPITRAFLDAIDAPFPLNSIVDTKVVMMMPGWYPCIPGWHHDDVARPDRYAQPAYAEMGDGPPPHEAYHAMGLVDCGTGSRTEFVHDRVARGGWFDLSDPRTDPSRPHYGVWNDDIELLLKTQPRHADWEVTVVPDRTVVYFDNRSWHRGVRATGHGWRWFGRIAADTGKLPVNEIRTQTQIYSDSFTEGW